MQSGLNAGVIMLVVCVVLAGCASAPTRTSPLPESLSAAAQVPGIPGARYWGDGAPPGFDAWLELPESEIAANFSGIVNRDHNYLALSGGGADGAYGAGILVGWTASGTRPEFTMVTGTNTGALIAPFAFLGAKYDPVLRRLYTELSTDDLVERRNLLDIVRNESATSSAPLRRLLEQYIDDAFVAELAEQHRRGRSLLIGTTNLDADRPVTWSVTRIAASGSPRARSLIHDVLLASASIPGVFPPVMIDVEADGRRFDEMHVDGGRGDGAGVCIPGRARLEAGPAAAFGEPAPDALRHQQLARGVDLGSHPSPGRAYLAAIR